MLRIAIRYRQDFCGVPVDSFEQGAALWRTLYVNYGFGRSCETRSCIDAAGQPIPWYTYPTIEFLGGLSFAGKKIWEYGCGHSTLWWAQRAATVVGVEDNPEWYRILKPRLPANCSISLVTADRRAEYVRSILETPERADVIVVDGPAVDLYRYECCTAAVDRLADGGMILLDNSDWLPQSCEYLNEIGFTQIDFNGFSPINNYPGRTSIFFRGALSFDRLPHRPTVGGVDQNWETLDRGVLDGAQPKR